MKFIKNFFFTFFFLKDFDESAKDLEWDWDDDEDESV